MMYSPFFYQYFEIIYILKYYKARIYLAINIDIQNLHLHFMPNFKLIWSTKIVFCQQQRIATDLHERKER